MKFKMYHATPYSNVTDILKYGLEPRPTPHHKPKPSLWSPTESVVYLVSSIDTAKEFADQSYKLRKSNAKAWGIFKIEYDEFQDEVYPDLDWGIPGVHYVKRWIPPEHLTLVQRYFVHYLNIRRVKKGNPSSKYSFVKRTKRGSLVAITEKEGRATVEIPNHEDMSDLTNMLRYLRVKFDTRHGISKSAWEGAPSHLRGSRGVYAEYTDPYPGWTVELDFAELQRAIDQTDMFLTPGLLE